MDPSLKDSRLPMTDLFSNYINTYEQQEYPDWW